MDIKITGVTFDILRDALEQANKARQFILGKMAEAIEAPREQLSQFAPRIQTIQIDPEKIGLLIGKGGETIRGLAEEFESQIDVNDDGQVLIYSANGELGDALVDRIRSMTKEVEVGDEFRRQGRQDDDLRRLRRARQGHRRPAAHLQRLARPAGRHGRGVSSTRATRSTCASSRSTTSAAASACASPTTRRSQARPPRSWRRSAPAATAEAAGTAANGGRDAMAIAAVDVGPIAAGVSDSSQLTELESGVRVVTEAVPSVRSVALGLWVRTGSRNETHAQEGVSHFLEHMLFKGTKTHSAIEISELFDGLGASVNAATGKETTHLNGRFLDEHTEEAFELLSEMFCSRPTPRSTPSARSCWRRSRCTRTSRWTACTISLPRRCSASIHSDAGSSAAPR